MSIAVTDNPRLLPVLPEDALVEILSRLPVESILRFKCVCKSWYALFNNPTFAAKHLQLVKANHGNQHVFVKRSLTDDDRNTKWLTCFFCEDAFDRDVGKAGERDLSSAAAAVEETVVDLSSDYNSLNLIGHCDGIVVLHLTVDGSGFDSECLILCNPATRQSRTLPSSSFHPIPYGYNKFVDDSFQPAYYDYELHSTDYDVHVVNNFIGFGYDPKTKDYKVVRDVRFSWDTTGTVSHKVEVFSIGTDSSWREIDGEGLGDAQKTIFCSDHHFEQYFEGVCYWWGTRYDSCYQLISFDMANEVFRVTPMPEFYTDPGTIDFFPIIGIYNNESIALYVVPLGSDADCMEVWVMKEFGVNESWTKQLTITSSVVKYWNPLLFWKNHDELLYIEQQGSRFSDIGALLPIYNLFSYNFITHESKSLPLRGEEFSACRYIKSIVSVNTVEEVINVA